MKDNVKKVYQEFKKDYRIKLASDIIQEDIIRTGIYPLDYVLDGGIRFWEGGHIIEFYGAESAGKSTFALYVIRKYQKLGKVCAYINAENSYDKEWAEKSGVDNENLLIASVDSLEQAGDLIVELIPKLDLIVIDSIIALIPEEEIEKELAKKNYASQAKVNSPMTRKIYKAIAEKNTTLLFINQIREKIGTYGNPYTTSGGRALKHMYNTRIEFRAGKPIDVGSGDNKERVGVEINLKCVKNKKGKPYHKAIVDFYFNGHIDNKKTLFFSGIKYEIIEKSGHTYTFGKTKIVGKENFQEELSEKDWVKIEKEIWKRMK